VSSVLWLICLRPSVPTLVAQQEWICFKRVHDTLKFGLAITNRFSPHQVNALNSTLLRCLSCSDVSNRAASRHAFRSSFIALNSRSWFNNGPR
jgi:hypothetical protein